MSREIKFRAWDTGGNSWLPSALLQDLLMIGVPNEPFEGIFSIHDFQTQRIEIQQYTGLKDKNGRDIYEGDILGATYGGIMYKSVVRFGWAADAEQYGSSYGWYTDSLETDEKVVISTFKMGWGENREVIGNIYENPELVRFPETLSNPTTSGRKETPDVQSE